MMNEDERWLSAVHAYTEARATLVGYALAMAHVDWDVDAVAGLHAGIRSVADAYEPPAEDDEDPPDGFDDAETLRRDNPVPWVGVE